MRTIIAGSRGITWQQHVSDAVRASGFTITEVVSGAARGVDRMGETWAIINNVPVKRFPADWSRHGKRAGYVRNAEMAAYADALIAIWDGKSRGTRNMIDEATATGLKVHVAIVGVSSSGNEAALEGWSS